jgi:hypothetical protein
MIARSRKIPSAGAITSTVSGTAITWGTPWLTDSSQSTYARNMPIAPCAKLKMPVVVYTTTSPVADIARMPAIGSAKMTMSTRVVNVTGITRPRGPAHDDDQEGRRREDQQIGPRLHDRSLIPCTPSPGPS